MSTMNRAIPGIAAAFLLLSFPHCGIDLRNQTASLGASRAGDRGIVRVVFINNTPHRAAFTYGTYDQLDPDARPDFEQFGTTANDPILEAGTSSDVETLSCARVFSIGEPALLTQIEENLPDANVIEAAFDAGVTFYNANVDGAEPTVAGTASPFAARLGIDFPCNALLIIRFEIDDLGPDPFRVDFEIIPSESDR